MQVPLGQLTAGGDERLEGHGDFGASNHAMHSTLRPALPAIQATRFKIARSRGTQGTQASPSGLDFAQRVGPPAIVIRAG